MHKDSHRPKKVCVAVECGRIECSCGWNSHVDQWREDFTYGTKSGKDAQDEWIEHIVEILRENKISKVNIFIGEPERE